MVSDAEAPPPHHRAGAPDPGGYRGGSVHATELRGGGEAAPAEVEERGFKCTFRR